MPSMFARDGEMLVQLDSLANHDLWQDIWKYRHRDVLITKLK